MTWKAAIRRALAAAMTLIGTAALVPMPLAGEELVFKPSTGYCAEIDGADASDARFYVTDPKGRLLVELPSLSTSVLISPKEKKVTTLPPSSIRREDEASSSEQETQAESDGSTPRLFVQVSADAPISPVTMDGPAWRFQIDKTEVRILKAADCQKAAASAIPVAGEELVLAASDAYCAEINGAYAPDVRFFATEPKGRLLVDLPSLSSSALITLKAKEMVTLPRSTFKVDGGENKARLLNPVANDAPVSPVSMGAGVWSFKIADADVRILKASECHPVTAAYAPSEPVTNDLAAKKCLHKDARPIPETAGCSKSAFLTNSCDVAVVAVVQTTQHLFSGTLPETSSVVIPPRSNYVLGCFWPKGAMSPANYEVLAAAFARQQANGR